MNDPKVSIIMPVYNGERFLRDSVDSILQQTYGDFELIIINDGSTDGSVEVIQSYGDSRIRLFHNDTNRGLASTRNRGLDEARGEYIAWLDADDISLPRRIETQVHVLNEDPTIGICGTWAKTFGSSEEEFWCYPENHDEIICEMLFYDPLVTSSVMIRKKVLVDNNISFNPEFSTAEDYDLWERASHFCCIVNIPEILTRYRVHGAQTTSAMADSLKRDMDWLIQSRRVRLLGIDPTERQRLTHHYIVRMNVTDDYQLFRDSEEWMVLLIKANSRKKRFPKLAFKDSIGIKWLTILMGTNTSKYYKLWKILTSPFHGIIFKISFLFTRIIEEMRLK